MLIRDSCSRIQIYLLILVAQLLVIGWDTFGPDLGSSAPNVSVWRRRRVEGSEERLGRALQPRRCHPGGRVLEASGAARATNVTWSVLCRTLFFFVMDSSLFSHLQEKWVYNQPLRLTFCRKLFVCIMERINALLEMVAIERNEAVNSCHFIPEALALALNLFGSWTWDIFLGLLLLEREQKYLYFFQFWKPVCFFPLIPGQNIFEELHEREFVLKLFRTN